MVSCVSYTRLCIRTAISNWVYDIVILFQPGNSNVYAQLNHKVNKSGNSIGTVTCIRLGIPLCCIIEDIVEKCRGPFW